MLHVDKGGVEPGQPDDLDDLRIGDAAGMSAEGQPAPARVGRSRAPRRRFRLPPTVTSASKYLAGCTPAVPMDPEAP